MSTHTPEPWIVSEHVPTRIDEVAKEYKSLSLHGVAMACDSGTLGEANAKRIVDCVNACKGIEDSETTVPELVAVCTDVLAVDWRSLLPTDPLKKRAEACSPRPGSG